MIFQRIAAFFQPDELGALTDAYEAAWQRMRATIVRMTAEEAAAVQTKLAQIILASACTGERDMERLKDIALRGISGSNLVEAPEA